MQHKAISGKDCPFTTSLHFRSILSQLMNQTVLVASNWPVTGRTTSFNQKLYSLEICKYVSANELVSTPPHSHCSLFLAEILICCIYKHKKINLFA